MWNYLCLRIYIYPCNFIKYFWKYTQENSNSGSFGKEPLERGHILFLKKIFIHSFIHSFIYRGEGRKKEGDKQRCVRESWIGCLSRTLK